MTKRVGNRVAGEGVTIGTDNELRCMAMMLLLFSLGFMYCLSVVWWCSLVYLNGTCENEKGIELIDFD